MIQPEVSAETSGESKRECKQLKKEQTDMKKTYITPAVDVTEILMTQMLLETSGVEFDSSTEADPEGEVLTKEEKGEFLWEEEEEDIAPSDNYWE